MGAHSAGPKNERPGWRSWAAALALAGEALLELGLLPFRLVLFSISRRTIARDLRALVEKQAKARPGGPAAGRTARCER